ncbi:MAG: hypothetical protein IJS84_03285 [Spirochaetales bacterium]|nr:hypothetical protein [Spirochaetales bacterium]
MEQNDRPKFSKMDTGKGNALKRLKNITCPYTGIRMISGSEMGVIEERLKGCRNAKEKIYLFSRYAKNMQPVEHHVFDRITFFLDSNPEKGLMDFFSSNYSDHLAKLKLEELKVIDSVDTRSTLLSTQTQMDLRRETTNCRNQILGGSNGVFFKRKSFLTSLEGITARNPYEKRVLSDIMNLALFLPTSGSSENAFMIKYSRRDEDEILRRLIMGSVATIEHVKPHSLGGENEISNFLLVSNNGNRYRENVPLSVYIDRHPGIPEYCQTYIDEIIDNIHKGRLKGNESYPYKIRKTLFEESEGRILLDLSGYRIPEEKAAEMEASRHRAF